MSLSRICNNIVFFVIISHGKIEDTK